MEAQNRGLKQWKWVHTGEKQVKISKCETGQSKT